VTEDEAVLGFAGPHWDGDLFARAVESVDDSGTDALDASKNGNPPDTDGPPTR